MANFTNIDRLKSVVVNTAAGGTVEAVAAVTGKRIKVYGLFLYLASSTTVSFQSATTTLTGLMTMTSIIIQPIEVGGRMVPIMKTVAGEALNIAYGGLVQCSGIIFYTNDDT